MMHPSLMFHKYYTMQNRPSMSSRARPSPSARFRLPNKLPKASDASLMPRKKIKVQDVYDQNRRLVEAIVSNPDISEEIKISVRNLGGYMCAITGINAMAVDGIIKKQVTPLAEMQPQLNVDFRPFLQDPIRR